MKEFNRIRWITFANLLKSSKRNLMKSLKPNYFFGILFKMFKINKIKCGPVAM